jgi:hypothetical protein
VGAHRTRVLAGAALFVAGVLVGVSRSGDVHRIAQWAADWWPAIFVIWAAYNLTTFLRRSFRSGPDLPVAAGAAAFLLAASILLLFTLNKMPHDTGKFTLPAALMAAGLALLTAGGAYGRSHSPWVAERAILRRQRFVSRAKAIRHLSVQAVLGELTLDLTRATFTGDSELHATVWAGRIRVLLDPVVRLEDPRVSGPNVILDIDTANAAGESRYSLGISVTGANGRLSVRYDRGSVGAGIRAAGSQAG